MLAVIVAVCAVDAFFPVVPSETTVIAAGVVVAAGEQSLTAVVAVAAAGAFAGDQVSYLLGRHVGTRAAIPLTRRRRGRNAYERARRALRNRGGLIIVAARFIPGGRTATTLTAGTVGYPFGRFLAFDAIAAVLWAPYAALIGYWAGELFTSNAMLAILFGIGVSVTIAAVTEGIRRLVGRNRRHIPQAPVR